MQLFMFLFHVYVSKNYKELLWRFENYIIAIIYVSFCSFYHFSK